MNFNNLNSKDGFPDVNEESDQFHNSIEISYKNITPPAWAGNVEGFCKKVLAYLGIKNWEVSLLFCDDSFIMELNEHYRGKTGPTDVLAFPQGYSPDPKAEKIYAGDIVISVPSMQRNAQNLEIPGEEELKRLIIHGILHLNGMDHKAEECEMLVIQEKLVKDL